MVSKHEKKIFFLNLLKLLVFLRKLLGHFVAYHFVIMMSPFQHVSILQETQNSVHQKAVGKDYHCFDLLKYLQHLTKQTWFYWSHVYPGSH